MSNAVTSANPAMGLDGLGVTGGSWLAEESQATSKNKITSHLEKRLFVIMSYIIQVVGLRCNQVESSRWKVVLCQII
jgi:hypothetical protein